MQAKTGGPRAALSDADIEEVLSHASGARIRWGVVVIDANGNERGQAVLNETTNEDWEAGTLDSGLVVVNGTVTGE